LKCGIHPSENYYEIRFSSHDLNALLTRSKVTALGSQPPLDKKSGTTAVCEGLARYAVLNVETWVFWKTWRKMRQSTPTAALRKSGQRHLLRYRMAATSPDFGIDGSQLKSAFGKW